MAGKKRRPLKIESRRDWPFQYTVCGLLVILTALALLTSEWAILGVSAVAILLAYMLKKEWEK